MNIMRIKRIGKMATAAIIAFNAVVVIINPQKAQASQEGAVTVTASSNYVLDDSHNVDISITAYVEYAYDEGAYGWVINIIPQSWSKTSDNVTIDQRQHMYSIIQLIHSTLIMMDMYILILALMNGAILITG